MYVQWPYYYRRSLVNPYYRFDPNPIYKHEIPPGGVYLDQLYVQNYNDFYRRFVEGPYPEVDPTSFKESAEAFRKLMLDAGQLFTALGNTPNLARDMMDAAQVNDMNKVERLIKSTGVKGKVELKYTPDSLRIKMVSQAEETECCQLTMVLRW